MIIYRADTALPALMVMSGVRPLCQVPLKKNGTVVNRTDHLQHKSQKDTSRLKISEVHAPDKVTFKLDYLTHLSGCVCQCVPVWDSQM